MKGTNIERIVPEINAANAVLGPATLDTTGKVLSIVVAPPGAKARGLMPFLLFDDCPRRGTNK